MIKRLLPGNTDTQAKILERRIPNSRHRIQPQDFSPLAIEVVNRLLDGGHEAYIVGGCVRDLLLGKKPKDFDVSTSATPEQVKKLFRRSRVVGRRFKIVHVRQGRELIEVTTFRGNHESGHPRHAGTSDSGMIVRDNVYGTLEEDALRRDFTCNSLYYDIDSHELVDFLGGSKDLKKGILRAIGNPAERFREDPVRVMRALRFQAKLGLKLDSQSNEQLGRHVDMIREVSTARLFDEVVKLFMHNQAGRAFELARNSGLFSQLFPCTVRTFEDNPKYVRLLEVAMESTERRLGQNKSVSPFFLYGVLLWPAVEQEYLLLVGRNTAPAKAMDMAGARIIAAQSQLVSISKRFSQPMRETWHLQTQLKYRTGQRVEQLLKHPRFRAAYDLLLMREQAGSDQQGLGTWWTEYQNANERTRREMTHTQMRGYTNRRGTRRPHNRRHTPPSPPRQPKTT